MNGSQPHKLTVDFSADKFKALRADPPPLLTLNYSTDQIATPRRRRLIANHSQTLLGSVVGVLKLERRHGA